VPALLLKEAKAWKRNVLLKEDHCTCSQLSPWTLSHTHITLIRRSATVFLHHDTHTFWHTTLWALTIKALGANTSTVYSPESSTDPLHPLLSPSSQFFFFLAKFCDLGTKENFKMAKSKQFKKRFSHQIFTFKKKIHISLFWVVACMHKKKWRNLKLFLLSYLVYS
jgi:hypothetical protein